MACCNGQPFVALAPRLIGALIEIETATSTEPLVPGDVDSIAYTVTDMSTDTVITSGTLTPVSSYIFDPPREGDKFGEDLPTWNFEHRAPGTFFPEASIGNEIEVRYEFLDSMGALLSAPLCIRHPVVSCVSC